MQYPARRPTGIESLSGERKQNKFEQISFSKTYLKARAVSVKYNQSRISNQDKLKSINNDKQKTRLALLANKFLTDPNNVYYINFCSRSLLLFPVLSKNSYWFPHGSNFSLPLVGRNEYSPFNFMPLRLIWSLAAIKLIPVLDDNFFQNRNFVATTATPGALD